MVSHRFAFATKISCLRHNCLATLLPCLQSLGSTHSKKPQSRLSCKINNKDPLFFFFSFFTTTKAVTIKQSITDNLKQLKTQNAYIQVI
jgi:hypothetical protein